MKKQSKSTLILIVTLLIGMAIGVLGYRVYMLQRIREFKDHRADLMFEKLFARVVQPTPEQADTLRVIWQKYREQLESNHKQVLKETKTILDSMFKEMRPLLTEEQIKRLKERRHRDKRPHFHNRKPRPEPDSGFYKDKDRDKPSPPNKLFLE
ncbi:MAG: hypothetical protein U5R06_11155 [candidate division KSB1 bacterium]|nr:hypothetical protein [candidate division KSB1 bacterium]